MPSVFKIIKTEAEIDKLISYCEKTGYASVDFETNAQPINHSSFYPTIIGISFQPGSSYIVPLGHFDSPFKNRYRYILKKIGKGIMENKNITKVAWNAKFEYRIFKKYGISIKGRYFDAMLAKYLLNEERPNDLKSIVSNFIPEYAGYQENYEGSKLPWDQKPLKGLSEYCGLDCDLTLRLMLFFEKQLIKGKFYNLFRNMLMMATRVLGDSEYSGMDVDEKYLDELITKYSMEITNIEKKIANNRKVKKFEKALIDSRVNDLISKVQEEIDEIKYNLKQLKKSGESEVLINREKRKLKTREDKITKYLARNFTTKNELKVIEKFNMGSPDQLGNLLFLSPHGFKYKIVKYTSDKKTKKESNRPSTDESVLLELGKKYNSEFLKSILEYRSLSKLYSTYIVGIKEKLVNGKVHGNFNLHGTVTGRLSSNEPNLQNIPRDTTASDIKKMFVPPKGHLLLQVDYSQAELRVMAAMAGEENMIRWFKEGKDIHLTVALKKDNCEHRYDEINKVLEIEDKNDPRFHEWKVKRKYAKTINFGIIYGQGPPKLAESLECSIDEAKRFLKDYFILFPKIKKFIQNQHKLAHKNAYVRNVFGRKRRLWKIDSYEKWEIAEAERQSVNAPIQGAASDYTLFSSILIWEAMLKGEIPIYKPQCYTVHDSLGYYVLPEHIHKVVPQIDAICSNPQTMKWFGFQIDSVKMQVDFEVASDNWGGLRKYSKDIDYTSLF